MKNNWVFSTLLSLSLLACTTGNPNLIENSNLSEHTNGNQFNPTSKGPKPALTDGSIITRFDIGQTLNPADFLILNAPITSPPKGFHTLQNIQNNPLVLSQMATATITVTSPLVQTPATATLSKDDISKGWTFVFKGIPEGAATVSLKIADASGNPLFNESQNVQVIAGSTTPVDFVIELASGSTSCQSQNCTGNIAVNVRAITNCIAKVNHPTFETINQSVLFNLENLEGNVESFTINFGDNSGNQSVNSFPLNHTYTQPGRYGVSITLNGSSCKNPYTINSFITIQ